MKAIILAGGFGTRLSEETVVRPKPMIEIGGRPILWHIMKLYSAHGINDFVICLGYKGYLIKEYFANYALHMSNVTFDVGRNVMSLHQNAAEPWKVTMIETGENTQTGGRLQSVADYLDNETFCFTYGDGVGDIDIRGQCNFHRRHGKLATVTAVQPPGRFGSMQLGGSDKVINFEEKPKGEGGWINGGFFVLERQVIDLIEDGDTRWEDGPISRLVAGGELRAWRHYGFWRPMDTLRDKQNLERLWDTGQAPWKVW